MKIILWPSCYIDLFSQRGVASANVEIDNDIFVSYMYLPNATINQLTLIAILKGLEKIQPQSDVEIITVCSYANKALHSLQDWIESDEIDTKSHSEILKCILELMSKMKKVSCIYHKSRRADPMLWATSQFSIEHFRNVQLFAIENNGFPNKEMTWSYENNFGKEIFLNSTFKKALTDIAMEKLIKKRIQLVDKPDNVIPFQRQKNSQEM